MATPFDIWKTTPKPHTHPQIRWIPGHSLDLGIDYFPIEDHSLLICYSISCSFLLIPFYPFVSSQSPFFLPFYFLIYFSLSASVCHQIIPIHIRYTTNLPRQPVEGTVELEIYFEVSYWRSWSSIACQGALEA